MDHQKHMNNLSTAGLLVALGIIYGDIGTSPLYTFQTILTEGGEANRLLVLGAISCVFWTLTLQTTFKYVLITLQADNHGEGGVFSLYALVRRYSKTLFYIAIIGAGTLLADGIITPPITITSAVEGLSMVKGLEQHIIPGNTLTVEIVMVILLLLFIFQRFGTRIVGGSFGPVMFCWFFMMGSVGLLQVARNPVVLEGLSPWYGIRLLTMHHNGFWLLGAIFLCTTGAEALYSDLGHCGRRNIRVSWIFVKTTLVLNYLGQGAWVLLQHENSIGTVNPFFAIVPQGYLLPAIALATAASIIASQALISGSFTLINEAMSLGFWPRINVKYPSNIRGQIYIPSINWILFIGCALVLLYFRTSEAMTAAYGFSITIAMLMTTFLMFYYLRYVRRMAFWIVGAILTIFVCVETSFFIANAVKIVKRLFFLVFEIGLISTMYIWFNARRITQRFLTFVNLPDYIPMLEALSRDPSVPKYSSHLVYFTRSAYSKLIEKRILDSIFDNIEKKADLYWFVHIERTDDPYTMEYGVEEIRDDKIIRVDFRLGFRVQPKIGLMLRKVVQEMINNKELDIVSRYPVFSHIRPADFRFVIMKRFLSYDNEFSAREGFILNAYFSISKLAQSDKTAYGLDNNQTVVEYEPLVVNPVTNITMKRAFYKLSSSDEERKKAN
ncbi:MAG TPA: KUP/HAK/KT family potassium transporter [Puia sp.]|nr:KUP/HAK/KT family potassium transporter [Puia sp.]